MTSILDRLTDAMSAAAGTVRDEELRPLVTPPRRRRQPTGGRRWRPAWAAPVAAAIAVLLVIGLAVSVSNRLFGTQQPAGPAHLPPAPRQFNPLLPNMSFGWLPAGESLGQGGVRRTDVYLAAGRPPGLLGWGLSVYARGAVLPDRLAQGGEMLHSGSEWSVSLAVQRARACRERAPCVLGR
jgi:hypothetical protein